MTCKQPVVVVVLVGVSCPGCSSILFIPGFKLNQTRSYNESYLMAVIAGLMRLDEGGEENR